MIACANSITKQTNRSIRQPSLKLKELNMANPQIKNEFKDQSRWNNYGREYLEILNKEPSKGIIELQKKAKKYGKILGKLSLGVEGKKILDLGCGEGELSIVLSKLGGIVIGIDMGSDLIELAKKLATINNENCQFIAGDVCQLPFPNNEFDFVVGSGILHHLSEAGVRDALKETHKVLKNGGIAFFTEPIEDNKVVNYLKNFIPMGTPGSHKYRPSILQRKRWKEYLINLDDRHLSTKELIDAKGDFQNVNFDYYGVLSRAGKLLPEKSRRKIAKTLNKLDPVLLSKFPLARELAGQAIITYYKALN